jgi:hypothetical protein
LLKTLTNLLFLLCRNLLDLTNLAVDLQEAIYDVESFIPELVHFKVNFGGNLL